MIEAIKRIRPAGERLSAFQMIWHTALLLALGVALGLLAKFLDELPSNELPFLLERLDLANFLSGFSFWVLLSVIISVYSRSPLRAGINAFCFLTGMLVGYYTYTAFISGFFPRSYIMIWVIMTLFSPLLAAVCWLAKGSGVLSMVITSGILMVFFLMAFAVGFLYFDIFSMLDVLMWLICIAVLYQSPKQIVICIGASSAAAILISVLRPYLPF